MSASEALHLHCGDVVVKNCAPLKSSIQNYLDESVLDKISRNGNWTLTTVLASKRGHRVVSANAITR